VSYFDPEISTTSIGNKLFLRQKTTDCAGFEVLTAVAIKSPIFWDITLQVRTVFYIWPE
jgi:hypothetical protein